MTETLRRLPTEPGAYWRPNRSLSKVWSLRRDGTWHFNITGKSIPEDEVPDGLELLGLFK